MSNPFTGKNSYSLIKTNPKLTGNVKLVVDSNGNIYLETIDADKQLSLNKYKAVRTNERRKYSSDVYELFNKGEMPASLVYKLAQNEDFLSVKNEYFQQYYTPYTQGAYPKVSKEFKEQIGYFAPIWLETEDIPENFVIFKLKNPVSVNTSEMSTSYDDAIEKQIYNPDYFNGDTSNYFFETILKDCVIHKVYDMSEDSVLGKYIRNHVNDNNFPEAPITVKYNQSEYTTYNGISLKKSGFIESPEESFSDFFVTDKTITEFDNHVTNGFERNSVICGNILNMEFLFDDETEDEYEISRYFGFFVNDEVISKFFLDGKDFYAKKSQNFIQNKNIKTNDQINIEDNKNFTFSNPDGVKLFIDGLTSYNLASTDVKGGNYMPYVKGAKNKHFNVNVNTDWGTDEIVLKTTQAELRDFKGYTDESVGVIPANIAGVSGRGYVEFTINGPLDNVEIRLKNVDEHNANYIKETTFISDTSLTQGTHIINKFSVAGTPENNAKALTDCINEYAGKDDNFGLSAVTIGNKVIIASRVQNDFANTYKWLIYSDDNNEPPITINFGDLKFGTVAAYNAEYRGATGTDFQSYNQLGTGATASANDWILQSTLIGGRTSKTSRIKVSSEFFSYFNSTHFLKTTDWYSRIKGVYRNLDESVVEGRILVNFDNFFEYIIIDIEDDSDVYISNGGYSYIYDLKPNDVGLFSFYPIKQFDIDQFRSSYNKDGDGYINKQLEYITDDKGISSIPVDLESAIGNFTETGFAGLVGNIDEITNDSIKIDNEYDRLKENELPELGTPGRVIPFINKWVFDNDAKDVRENPYRLNTSVGFGFSSFAASEFYKTADPRYYTHEWYYLQKFPPYLSEEDRVNTFSYFEEFLPEADVLDITDDKFSKYFIQEKVGPNIDIPRRVKYSIFANGDSNSYSSTMFRGSKLIIKRRNENNIALNFNIKNIVTYPSDYFNGYKFVAILTNDTDNPISYKVIENKKFKTITFFIQANLDDYYLTLDAASNRYLDRSTLYILKDKYVDTFGGPEIADINLSGAISPYTPDNSPSWTIAGDGSYVIPGFQSLLNGSLPDFKTQILPNQSGGFNDITIQTPKGFIKISGILEINEDTIRATAFEFSSNGVSYSPFNTSYLNIYPNYSESVIHIPKYLDGGFNAFTGIIQNLSFGTIFTRVNNGNPSIQYISIGEDENGNPVTTENEFLIEFVKSDINAKASYLEAKSFITNAIKANDYKPIGSQMSNLNKTYLTPLSRIKGNFVPKIDDIIVFNDNHESKFTPEIREQLLFKNVQFFANYPGFALYKQLYINKVNTDNPLTVLELTRDTQLKPQWWKINEIAIANKDQYIFRSDWDHNYYRKYVNKSTFTSLPGYVEPKEIRSMLASTIMNIPDRLNLEKFNAINADTVTPSESPNAELVYKLFRTRDNINKIYKIKGKLFTRNKLVNQISPELEPIFQEYVNPLFNFDDLNILSDDTSRYTRTNILPRYEVETVQVYAKFIPIGENDLVIENKYTVQELIQNGYKQINDVIISGVKENDYDKTFEYILPKDQDAILAFIIKIKSD